MNALTRQEANALPALAMDQAELMAVLRTSLYPGAQDDSIKMALGYCKAAGLDPMQKPVHIVPMWDRVSGGMRDVIMPGIGLYRTQAARSGALAGISEPEFGEDITTDVGGQEITFPNWCRVTVKRRMPDGTIAEFTAREFWRENYAVRGGKEKSIAPNAMWAKRPYGQLAKCAQAQALRTAFPEMTGSQPTAEEMEGKTDFDEGRTIDAPARAVEQRAPTPSTYPADQFEKNLPAWRKVIEAGRKTPAEIIAMAQTKHPLTDEQRAAVMALAKAPDAKPAVTYAQVATALNAAKDIDALNTAADLIGEVADPGHRAELSAIFDARNTEFQGA